MKAMDLVTFPGMMYDGKDMKQVECWHCGKEGHMQVDCWIKQKDDGGKSKRKGDSAKGAKGKTKGKIK
eukprot:10811602-Heterocapsa_arctica.AAC.1